MQLEKVFELRARARVWKVNPPPGHLCLFEKFKLPNLEDSMGFPWGT